MKRSYDGRLNLLAASDGIPVILFDRNLVIVDYNSSAAEKGFEKFLGKTLAEYMSVHEASSVRSFLFVHGTSPNAPKSRLSRIEGLPGGTRALISVKEMFGTKFGEMKIFRSNSSMLKYADTVTSLLPGEFNTSDYIPSQDTESLLASDMLTKLYMKCSREEKEYTSFDVPTVLCGTLKEISSGKRRIKSEISFSNLDGKPFVSSLFDIGDFINCIISILTFADNASESGKIEITADFPDGSMKIYFKTVFKKPCKETSDKISFCDFEEYYPRYATFAHVIEYMSNIFDTLFDAEIDCDNNFIGELTVDRTESPDASDFHSPETVDFANLVEKAFKFTSVISSCAEKR